MAEQLDTRSSTEYSDPNGRRAAEQAARLAYGRLVASLCQRGASLSESEDALSEAFLRALDRWPVDGVPDAPDAWLLTTARRHLIDEARHAAVARRVASDAALDEDAAAPLETAQVLEPLMARLDGESALSDRRLSLMMLCAHPEIPANARAPLMLQSVLGVSAQAMSAAFVTSPAALGQRLTRAKRRIKERSLPFTLPDKADWQTRLHDVLEAIYAAFSTAYESVETARDARYGLAHEAIWLAQILVQELEQEAEAHGLLSLMLFVQARARARRDADGAYVPLSDQKRVQWNWRLVAIAEHHLGKAAELRAPGRFQIEAAIQSHHMLEEPQSVDWAAVAALYDALVVHAPTLAAWVGRAAAHAEADGADSGLVALSNIPEARVVKYQPYWAVRAHLLARSGQREAASEAYERAAGLCEDAAVREFLLRKKQSLQR